MTDAHSRQQVKVLSLVIRILLVSGHVRRQDLVRAAKIAAAEVRAQDSPRPETERWRHVEVTPET